MCDADLKRKISKMRKQLYVPDILSDYIKYSPFYKRELTVKVVTSASLCLAFGKLFLLSALVKASRKGNVVTKTKSFTNLFRVDKLFSQAAHRRCFNVWSGQ